MDRNDGAIDSPGSGGGSPKRVVNEALENKPRSRLQFGNLDKQKKRGKEGAPPYKEKYSSEAELNLTDRLNSKPLGSRPEADTDQPPLKDSTEHTVDKTRKLSPEKPGVLSGPRIDIPGSAPERIDNSGHDKFLPNSYGQKAHKFLVEAGVDPAQVFEKYGEDHPDRARVEKAVAQVAAFSKSMRNEGVAAAVDFAFKNGGDKNLMTFGELYQYFKVDVDRQIKEKKDAGLSLAEAKKLTVEEFPQRIESLGKQLAKRLARVEDFRCGAIWAPPHTPPEELAPFVRSNAYRLGLPNPFSTLRHAEKHEEAMPRPGKDPDDPIGTYMHYLREVLSKGEIVDIQSKYQGQATRMIMQLEFESNDKKKNTILEAIIFAHPGGRIVVSSFGKPRALKSD